MKLGYHVGGGPQLPTPTPPHPAFWAGWGVSISAVQARARASGGGGDGPHWPACALLTSLPCACAHYYLVQTRGPQV